MAGPERALRLAIIGLGFGKAVQLPAFLGMSGVEVVAVAASRLAKASEAAAAFGIPLAFDNLDELLNERIDAVSLALPPATGAAVARQALEREIAVLTEKPLAGSAADALSLARLAERKATAVVDFTFRELPAFLQLKTMIDESVLGRVRRVAVTWLTYSYAHRNSIWSWKVDADRHGGVMTAQGSHALYLLEWLFGPATLEHAKLDHAATLPFTPHGARAAEDGATLVFGLGSGATATMVMSNASPGTGYHRWEVVCDDGTIVVQNQGEGIMGGFSLTTRGHDGRAGIVVPPAERGATDDRIEPFRSLASRFLAAARTQSSCQPDFTAGSRVQELIEQVCTLAAQRTS